MRNRKYTITSCLSLLLLLAISSNANAVTRTDIDRFQLLRDKMKVTKLMKPLEHDFLFNLDLAASKKIADLISDADDLGAEEGTTSNSYATLLSEYNDTEYFVEVGTDIGIPLPSFKIGSFEISPDIRARADLGFSTSITARAQDFLNIPGSSSSGESYIQLFAQQDFKYGLNLGYTYKNHWFGKLFLYKIDRWDRYEIVTAAELQSQDGDIIDLGKEKNTNSAITIDYQLGYKAEEFSTYINIEELKVLTTTDTNGALNYGIEPLIHYHAQYTWDLYVMDFTLFAGIMKRKSYNFDDGFYKGVLMDFNYFPLDASVTLDSEFISLQPKLDLWLLTLDYAAKIPLNEKNQGFKSSAIHQVNFRLSF